MEYRVWAVRNGAMVPYGVPEKSLIKAVRIKKQGESYFEDAHFFITKDPSNE